MESDVADPCARTVTFGTLRRARLAGLRFRRLPARLSTNGKRCVFPARPARDGWRFVTKDLFCFCMDDVGRTGARDGAPSSKPNQ